MTRKSARVFQNRGLTRVEFSFYNVTVAMTELPMPLDEPSRTKYVMIMLRRALLLIVAAIEQAYNIDSKERVVIIIER